MKTNVSRRRQRLRRRRHRRHRRPSKGRRPRDRCHLVLAGAVLAIVDEVEHLVRGPIPGRQRVRLELGPIDASLLQLESGRRRRRRLRPSAPKSLTVPRCVLTNSSVTPASRSVASVSDN